MLRSASSRAAAASGRRSTTDARALSDPSGLIHNAATYYDPNQILLKLSFKEAYKGNLHLYAVDWDSTARGARSITVNGQTAVLSSEFNEGAWVSFPISVAAGGTVTITVDRTAGANAVLSGSSSANAGHPRRCPSPAPRRAAGWAPTDRAGPTWRAAAAQRPLLAVECAP